MASFISQLPTDPNPPTLPKYYGDAPTLLSQDKYDRRHSFRPSWISDDEAEHTVSYACVGAAKDDALETAVWINGMGGNRFAAGQFLRECVCIRSLISFSSAFLDGLFEMYRIRLIHIDRPGAGHSTSVPLTHRVEWSTQALLSILSHENIHHLSLISHSNGLIYTLHLLLHLPKSYTLRHWFMSSPFVIPPLSGSWSLALASYLPAPLTGNLGTLASMFSTSMGWYNSARMVSSGGLGGLTQGWGRSPSLPGSKSTTTAEEGDEETSNDDEPTRAHKKARKQYERFVKKQNNLYASHDDVRHNEHRKTFGGYFFSSDLFDEAMKRAEQEGLGYMGDEALISLRKGEGVNWGWPTRSNEDDAGEGDLYLRGFREWKERWVSQGRSLPRIRVAYGSEDGMILKKGRDHLKNVLIDRLGLVKRDGWREVQGAGHDDTLGVTSLTEPWVQSVVASAEEFSS
ncbi:BQ2448_4067 [Microbotryum intermedium]|uniref:BQ2448_4067 protein n=1 Tax=Microbotryum intermedium TaxID=269621 RepID=A0A238FFE8_9BASI|nr:BQ2448_4067 [Microbotryum intermedium]